MIEKGYCISTLTCDVFLEYVDKIMILLLHLAMRNSLALIDFLVIFSQESIIVGRIDLNVLKPPLTILRQSSSRGNLDFRNLEGKIIYFNLLAIITYCKGLSNM